jgi:mxaJ protein
MSSRFLDLVAIVVVLAGLAQAREVRVCADPDNLPFSDNQRQGFENKIADLLAHDLNAELVYVWQRMGRGFVREYINNDKCDLVIGIPSNYRPLLTTAPYYRSGFVFVTRRDRKPQPTSLDDPELRRMNKIGVQVLDEQYAPPGDALARRGMQAEIAGFRTTGKDAGSIIRAVVDGKVDAAIVWGPLAGYFVRNYAPLLQLTPVSPEVDGPGIPLTFGISMGVRKGNDALRNELQSFLERQQREIQKLLSSYGVPQLIIPDRAEDAE